MVHALTEVWRVMKPDGLLIDLRPIVSDPPVEIVADDLAVSAGNICHDVDRPDDLAADAAIQSMVDAGHFSPAESGTFKLASYWESLEDLLEYVADRWYCPEKITDEIISRAMTLEGGIEGESQIRIRSLMHLGKYRKR